MIPTRILYQKSDPADLNTHEWVGKLPLLNIGTRLALPMRAATRVTDVKLVLTPDGILEQVVFVFP